MPVFLNVILTNLISRLFSRSPASAPAAIESLLQHGYDAQQAGNFAAAERSYRQALVQESTNADAHYLIGALLGERGDVAAAATHLDRALALNPERAAAHAARANVYLMQEQHSAASASYERALALDPDNAVAYFNLGLVAQASGAKENAFRHFTRAYELAPDMPDLLKNLTLSNLEFGHYDGAEALLRRLLAHSPKHYEALRCLGLVLQKSHRPQEALACYESVREAGAGDPEFLNNFGIVLQDLGRLDEAIEKYGEAIALKPDFTLAIWHRSLAYLLRHDFGRGWPDYELRLKSSDVPPRAVAFPRWEGEPLSGKTLLIYAEQGLGDEIMFSSCIPDVLAAGGQVVLECSAKLAPVFARSFDPASVYPVNQARAVPAHLASKKIDWQIPIGSLPSHFRRDRADFPAHSGYLRAEPERVAAWRQRLEAIGPGLKVGISWQGGTHRSRRPVRSMPLARWQPILECPATHFVDLQYTDFESELRELHAATGIEVHSWNEVRADYEETAALATALDLVISVCTAAIHLGGALGRPVWVMAPFSPEWRYGAATPGMPWYPSVRVFRQPAYGEWEPVITEVAQSLRRLAAGAR